jgi:hypothetical protein
MATAFVRVDAKAEAAYAEVPAPQITAGPTPHDRMSIQRGNAFECRGPQFWLLTNLAERDRSTLVVAVGTRVRNCVMYDHAFPRIEFTQKNRDAFFDKRAILRQDPSLTLTGSTGLLFCDSLQRKFNGHSGLRVQAATIYLKIQFERKLYFALIILTVAR